jgi:hypothetical protein
VPHIIVNVQTYLDRIPSEQCKLLPPTVGLLAAVCTKIILVDALCPE